MRKLLFALFLGLSVSHSHAAKKSNPHKAAQPNIVFILADDLGIGDVNCYGGDRCQIETPNIDAIAANGIRFTDAHVNASVCVPTRVGIMTGRYPFRFGKPEPGGLWGFLGTRFSPDTFTLARMFHTAGYRAGYVGKWHLGTKMTTKDGKVQKENNVDFTKPLKVGPPQYGFDDSFILPGSLDMYPYVFIRNNEFQGEVTERRGWSAFNRIGPTAKGFEDHEVLETFYRESESFISRQKSDQPFFLFLALTAPHTPTSPGKAWRGKSKLGVYGDFVMEVDHGVERVVSALKKNGLYQNTLVVFTSDHGPASYAGNILKATPNQLRLLEKQGHHANGPHRGYKFSAFEGGLRVPFIASWPGVTKPGSTCDALIGTHDLMATFAEITQGKVASNQAPDSISFANLLRDPKAKGRRENLIMQSIASYVVREGDWKLILGPGSGSHLHYGNTPRSDDAWKAAINKNGDHVTLGDFLKLPFVQLFNVGKDVHEDHNVAAQHPKKVAKLIELFKSQIANGRSTEGPMLANDRENIPLNYRLPQFVREQIRVKR